MTATAVILGKLLGDVLLTREKIEGLMQDLLYTDSPPAGNIKLSEWAHENAQTLGHRYATELGRRRNRQIAYAKAT